MATTDKSEWILLDTDLTTRLAILPVEMSHLYMELSEPGSGELAIPMDSTAAGLVTSGMFCQCSYRGSDRGGFFVENIAETHADISEGGGRWMRLSGRGPLALLEDAIIWDDGTTNTTREFTAKTKAYILKTLIDEAQARGGLSVLTYDFDAVNDSASVAWDDSESYRLNVGMSLFDLVRQFAKTGIDFDIVLSAGSFVLSAYKNGKGTDKSSTIYMRIGKNCEEVSTDERGDKIKNALRVAFKNGLLTVSDATSIANLRRREKLLDLKQAQTSSSATTYASAILDSSKDPRKSIKVKVYDGVSPRLFEDYGMGDTITLDKMGVESDYRILGIQADFDGVDYTSVVLELNSLLYDNELEMGYDLDWLLGQWATAEDAGLQEVSYWARIGGLDDSGTSVSAITKVGEKLYVGGYITRIGGVAVNNYGLAIYDIPTNSWTASAVGGPSPIYTITAYGTDLYVGGIESGYGGAIQKYDTLTDTWSELDTGVTLSGDIAIVYATAIIDDDLYVTGNFDDPEDGIARWDLTGGTWNAMDGGLYKLGGGRGFALTAIGSDLYVGGDFVEVGGMGGTAAPNVALWSGIAWAALDTGLDGVVYALAVYGTNVLAGGDFTDHISEWDGVNWATFGGGVDDIVRGLAVYLTDVYAVGDFTDVGNRIAKYSGGGWTQLEEGLNGSGYAIALNDIDVYVGGDFTLAGTKDVVNIAAYFNNFENLLDYLENSSHGCDVGGAIHNAPASAVTDSDEFGFWEDVSSALRKITWANIKATLDDVFVKIAQGVNDALMITDGSGNVTTLAASGDASQYLGGDLQFHDIPTITHLYLDDTNSDIGSHKTLTTTPPADPEATLAVSCVAADTLIAQFADTADLIEAITEQESLVHVHLAKTAGTKTVQVYAKLFVYHADTSETLIGTSENTVNLAATKTPYSLHMSLTALTFAVGDRRILRFYGTPGGGGTDPTATIYYEGTNESHLELGTTIAGGSGTPGGSDTEIQWNNAGSFDGTPGLYYDATNDIFNMGGTGGWDVPGEIGVNNLLNFLAKATNGAVVIRGKTWSATNNYIQFNGVRSRGTRASPAALESGDNIVMYGAFGHNGTGWSASSVAKYLIRASENWSAIAQGAELVFEGTPRTTTTREEFAVLDETGFDIPTGRQYLVNGTQHKHTQATSHESPDTDSATSSLHHTIGTSATQAAAGNHSHTYPCEGRLTLESGVPISSSDQSAKTTLYFALFNGDKIALYDGSSAWTTYTFTELSITNDGLSASKPYDVFIYSNSGTPTLELLVWTNDTTRATALTTQNGALVKSGATTRRYVGTIYTDAASKFNDTISLRNVWNYYNREPRPLLAVETTNTWSYTTANTYREVRAGSGGIGLSRVNYVAGWTDAFVRLTAAHCGGPAGAGSPWMMTGVGIDSTSTNSCQLNRGDYGFYGAGLAVCHAEYAARQSVGLHYAAWLERQDTAASITWFGNLNSAANGIFGEILG